MKDETHAFISDVKARGSTARSARNRRTHTGKGGKVRLPSDNLSKKELMKMSGECKSYRLNEPMTWKEFMSMPDDIKITYVKLLRQKFNAPGKYIAEMLGRNVNDYSKEIKRLGISEGKNCRGRCTPWDREGFYAWANGVDKLPTPVIEEQEHCEPDPVNHEEPEAFVEDDLPFEEPDSVRAEPFIALLAENEALKTRCDELIKSNEELIKSNEELMAVHEKNKAENAWLRNEHDSLQNALRMREAQLEIVQLIFGGKNRD